jgi:Methylamine utilisation protein MauE
MPQLTIPLGPPLGVLLAVAAATKAVRPQPWAAALRGYRLLRARRAVAVLVPLVEAGIAAGLLAGAGWAPWCAAGLVAAFTAVLAAELATGGRPPACGCMPFAGPPGRLTLLRNGALIAAAVAAGLGVRPVLGTGFWVASYAALWLAVAALAALVLSLTRQVGVLHLRLGPRGALEEAGAGPPLGARVDHHRLPGDGRAVLVAFTSAGCPMCRQIVPGLPAVARMAGIAVVHAAYEDADGPELHEAFAVPGTPFAVFVDPAGVVMAKGTVNTLEQLEGLVEAGRRRSTGALERVA